jgi:hypothetical protein
VIKYLGITYRNFYSWSSSKLTILKIHIYINMVFFYFCQIF